MQMSLVWEPWWENTSYGKRTSLGKAYPDEERLPSTVGISHPICRLKRKRKHRVSWCTHSSSFAVLKLLVPLPCMRKAWLLQKLLHPVSPSRAEALFVRCATWTGAHDSQSCPTYSMLSLGRWSDSLSRAPGRSCKQCLTNPGSVGSQSCPLCHLSYHSCLVAAARGMGSQWCYIHDSAWVLRKQCHFLGTPKGFTVVNIWDSQVWENLGLVSKRVSPSFHMLQLNKIQTCAGI